MIKYPHRCPKCKKVKATNRDELIEKFGLRKMKKTDKTRVAQSYCMRCRNK